MNYKSQFCLSLFKMYTSNRLFSYIFVITLLYNGEKCVGSVLENDRGTPETYIQFEDLNSGINKASSESDTPLNIIETITRLKIKINDAINRKDVAETKIEHVKRVTRQAHYDSKTLYPRLPTAPYQQQPYQNQNYNFNGQTNYTNPAYQQWHPSGSYNNSRPGYPAYNPSYNNTYHSPPYNPSGQRPSYPQGPYNNYNPNGNNQQQNNPNYNPGYPNRNPVLPGSPNINPYNPQGYPQPNNYSGYPPHSTQGRNNSYNPIQNPTYYQSGNSSNSQGPHYSYGNKYPNSFNSSTLSPSFNRNGYGSAQTNLPANWAPTGRVTNTSQSYYPGSSGHYRYQNNGSNPYGVNQYGASVSNLNGTQQTWPYYPTANNHQNYPASGPGSTGYNNSNNFIPNQGMYPKSSQYGTNYYPNNQFNGTSTFRLADTYTPSIPNQPPYNGNPQQNRFYDPSSIYGTYDPTKYSPNAPFTK